jgi:hypothetical protein
MAYLASIGQSIGGPLEARGYHIYRRGRTVFVYWGGIELGPDALYYWRRSTQHRIVNRPSVKQARQFVEDTVERRLERGYAQLPPGNKIHRHAGSKQSFPYRKDK